MRLFIEIKDSLMIVPNLCKEHYKYENCIIKKMNDSLRFIMNKHALLR